MLLVNEPPPFFKATRAGGPVAHSTLLLLRHAVLARGRVLELLLCEEPALPAWRHLESVSPSLC
jgi:predicted nicotinamide N-methyase